MSNTESSLQELQDAAQQFLSQASASLSELTPSEKLALYANALLLQTMVTLTQTLGQLPQAIANAMAGARPNILSLGIRLDELLKTVVAIPHVQTYLAGSANQMGVTVPAGGTTQILIPVAEGYVLGFLSDIAITPTSTQAGVTLSVTIDGYNLIGPEGFVLGPSAVFPVSQFNYFATRTGVAVTLANQSTSNVTVYFSFEMVNIATVFYREFLEPIFKQAYQQIKEAYGITGV